MSDSDDRWLAGVTSLSHDEVSRRLARTCEIIREASPEHAAAVLAKMVVIWSSPAGQQGILTLAETRRSEDRRERGYS